MDKRLDKLEAGQTERKRIESLETDVTILKLAVRTLSEELQALKMAQYVSKLDTCARWRNSTYTRLLADAIMRLYFRAE